MVLLLLFDDYIQWKSSIYNSIIERSSIFLSNTYPTLRVKTSTDKIGD